MSRWTRLNLNCAKSCDRFVPRVYLVAVRRAVRSYKDLNMAEIGVPFLKWPGGKRWLVPEIKRLVGAISGTYYEPFLGGGAAFFGLQPENAVLADLNPDLIHVYKTIRASPAALHQRLAVHQSQHDKRHYYQTRASRPSGAVDRAARILYLNRTCFNGIWRVNLRGEFNVPIGTKTTVVFKGESFRDIARSLEGVSLLAQDFEKTILKARLGDVVYADPPYTVAHNYNGFLKYNDEIFSWSDQVRLRDALKGAAERGARVLVSNANHESIRKLYGEFDQVREVSRYSVIAGAADRRAPTTELLISWGF